MQKNQTLRKNILLLPSDYNKLTNTILDAKAVQYKIVKIQTYYLSLFFFVQSYFFNNGAQNFFIFQAILNTFTMSTGITETIVAWQSKGLSK